MSEKLQLERWDEDEKVFNSLKEKIASVNYHDFGNGVQACCIHLFNGVSLVGSSQSNDDDLAKSEAYEEAFKSAFLMEKYSMKNTITEAIIKVPS